MRGMLDGRWSWLFAMLFAWLTLATALALLVNREFFVNDIVFVVVWTVFAIVFFATRVRTPRHR